ncbi:hypothetical protein F2Q68_00008038 [Brassica cretica]|uniref:Uncharacterized protein n=1 Tax=Brassica cretica TaxID=69181 RepID=A0A8S9KXP3_BRACR|nr:hypothetical protein F2Q68_00008038 [Brassica cretica]
MFDASPSLSRHLCLVQSVPPRFESSIDNIHGSSQRFCFRGFASRVVTSSPRVLRTARRDGVHC